MKLKSAILLATAPALYAGSPAPAPAPTPAPAEPWVTPIIDIRARYEFAEVAGLDQSNALTFRERLGLKTMEWNGFSALVEGEFSQAAVDHYNGGAPGADPFQPGYTPILDPETNELNQGYLQYSGFDNLGRVGRQRIKYDNEAFIGNVGWRQNEQTFDAIALENTWIEGLAFKYAYLNQINRIFGSEATARNQSYVMSESNLFNLNYSGLDWIDLTGYAYIMNFDEKANWDNNTFGGIAKGSYCGFDLYGELAWQDKSGFASDGNASYGHAAVTKSFGKQSLTFGIESLGAGFKTPLATVHAFNGYADVFATGRVEGAHNGLADTYLSYTMPIFWGIKWTNVLHAFGDNHISAGYGWEYDSVLAKKFDDHFTAIAKAAFFQSEGDIYSMVPKAGAVPDSTRVSVEVNYTF